MSSPGEITLEVMMLVFIICSFIGCVGCTSALLKKCYDKYVTDLPDEQEQSIVTIQNVELGYANATATVSIIPTVMVEPTFSEFTDDSANNVVAVEICL